MSDRPDPVAMCKLLGLDPANPHATGGTFSGGRIEHLTQGWARLAFKGNAGHWWRELHTDALPMIANGGRVRLYTSSCGLEGSTCYQRPAFGVGTMPICKKCLKKHRHPTAAERLTFVDGG